MGYGGGSEAEIVGFALVAAATRNRGNFGAAQPGLQFFTPHDHTHLAQQRKKRQEAFKKALLQKFILLPDTKGTTRVARTFVLSSL